MFIEIENMWNISRTEKGDKALYVEYTPPHKYYDLSWLNTSEAAVFVS
jgi:hypothetical protein